MALTSVKCSHSSPGCDSKEKKRKKKTGSSYRMFLSSHVCPEIERARQRAEACTSSCSDCSTESSRALLMTQHLSHVSILAFTFNHIRNSTVAPSLPLPMMPHGNKCLTCSHGALKPMLLTKCRGSLKASLKQLRVFLHICSTAN